MGVKCFRGDHRIRDGLAIDGDLASRVGQQNLRPAVLHEMAEVRRAVVPEAPGPVVDVVRPALDDGGARAVLAVRRESQCQTEPRATTAEDEDFGLSLHGLIQCRASHARRCAGWRRAPRVAARIRGAMAR